MQKVERDWGWYLVLRETPRTKWKILYFRRGAKLSLQRHFKREEKWFFLLGSGLFWRDHSGFEARIGETYTVPARTWHQYFANEPTIVLEKQTGICTEDDIERAWF